MPRATLKFATFNLYNLQLPGEPMYRGRAYTQAEYDAKIAWTGGMLKRIDADVIGFQELWHPDALEHAFRSAGLDGDYTLGTKLVAGGIANAVAVKKEHDLVSQTWIKPFPRELVLKKRKSSGAGNLPDYKISVNADAFSRAVLKAGIKPKQGGKPVPEITLFVAHLISKLPIGLDREESGKPSVKRHATAIGAALASIRRIAESAALRVLLTKEMSGNDTPVVVVGDLNDTEQSVSNLIITADPSYRLAVTSRAGSRSDVGLNSCSSLQEYRSLRDVNFTHGFNGRLETLDHLLVSEQFYDYSKQRKWSFKELRVYNDFVEDEDAW